MISFKWKLNYPGIAYQRAIALMKYEATKMFDLYEGDKFKLGYNIHRPEEILVFIDPYHEELCLWDDSENIKYFFEMRYDNNKNGCYITFKKDGSLFTQIQGYCFAKSWYMELAPSFTWECNGKVYFYE